MAVAGRSDRRGPELVIPHGDHPRHGELGRVHALAATLARFFADPVEIGVITSLALDSDPTAGEIIQQHWSPIVDSMTAVVDRAKRRGEVDPDLESGRLIELLTGPFVVHTTLVRRSSISRRHVKEIADLVVRAGQPAPAPPSP